ncbi:MAG TPA: serine/threonine protein kinase [Chromatiales bacterium]|nr:serine/threonine protein kinase [Chromatiales bacterium]
MIGTVISHYRILSQLGEGGMGVVYRSEDLKLDRTVALKFLSSNLVRDREAQLRFVHEAKAASALDHPNICNIHGIEETDDGRLFIAMACYEGETLKDIVDRGPLDLEDALEIAVQAAQGLAKAHSLGIVHRDIKPDNVFLTEDGLVKLLDFGIAKLMGSTQMTRPGTLLGTVSYMSPEQVRGEEVDRRTDLWSLGVVLYQMLSGRLPFEGTTQEAVLHAIVKAQPEPPGEFRGKLPPALERAVMKCLQKDVSERYQGMEALLQVLQPLVGRTGSHLTRQRTVGQHKLFDAQGLQPYPGLASFSAKEAEYFHGRESQMEAVWQKLRRERLLAVGRTLGRGKDIVPASGCGPGQAARLGSAAGVPRRISVPVAAGSPRLKPE